MWEYFLLSFILTAIFVFALWKKGGVGKWVIDHNKPIPRKVPVGGGLSVIAVISILYITFGFSYGVSIFGIVGMLLVALIIGLYDDLKGIRKWKKVPILLIAAIPILISYFYAGTNLWAPTILGINFSLFYWIFIIPIVIAGFANGGNVIAGYDGMETGVYTLMALLYLFIGFVEKNEFIIFLSEILFFSLLAMLIFNWYPSKILLGNVGSFALGAILGLIPLIGHFEIVLPIIFLPHLIEVYLQLKYTRKYSYDVFGEVDEKGVIHNKYGDIKSIIHWLISWGNMTEKKITLAMLGIESILCIVAFFSWYVFYIFV